MKKILSNKKGQVQTLAPAILALVFAAIVLVFGLIMTQELTSTQAGTTTKSVINESVSMTESSGIMTVNGFRALSGFGGWNATAVYNQTRNGGAALKNNTLIEGTDYTIGANNGTIWNLTGHWNATFIEYTYTDGGEAFISGNKTVQGLGTFADFWEIIVLAIVITIVIGLLLVVFGGRTRR